MKPFQLGDRKWQKAVINRRLDERSYEVETEDGLLRRNRIHLKPSKEDPPCRGSKTNITTPTLESNKEMPVVEPPSRPTEHQTPHQENQPDQPQPSMISPTKGGSDTGPAPNTSRYGRERKPPKWFGDYVQ